MSTPAYASLTTLLQQVVSGVPTTAFVRDVETAFAAAGLDGDDRFSDLQHALALYGGQEHDTYVLRQEAEFALRLLSTL